MIRGNTIDFIGHPLPRHFVSAHGASHHAWDPGPPSKSGAALTTPLYDVNELLETMQTTNVNNDNEEDKSDHTVTEVCTHSPEPTENDVIFREFEHICNRALVLGYQFRPVARF